MILPFSTINMVRLDETHFIGDTQELSRDLHRVSRKYRAIIFVLTDGEPTCAPDLCLEQKRKIAEYNSRNPNRIIRISTIGYFKSDEEKDARELLKALAVNPRSAFSTGNIDDAVMYITQTIGAVQAEPNLNQPNPA